MEIVSNRSGRLSIGPPLKPVWTLPFFSLTHIFTLSTNNLTYQGGWFEHSSPVKLKNLHVSDGKLWPIDNWATSEFQWSKNEILDYVSLLWFKVSAYTATNPGIPTTVTMNVDLCARMAKTVKTTTTTPTPAPATARRASPGILCRRPSPKSPTWWRFWWPSENLSGSCLSCPKCFWLSSGHPWALSCRTFSAILNSTYQISFKSLIKRIHKRNFYGQVL